MLVERVKYVLLPFLIVSFIIAPTLFAYPQKIHAQAATASCAAAYIGGLLAPLAVSLGLTTAGTGRTELGDAAAPAALVEVPVTNIVEGQQLAGQGNINAGGNLNTALGAAGATSISFKDCILVPLAEAMATRILANITNNLVSWIKGGFNGNPAFVTNMGDLISNSADQAIGSFIQSDPSLSLLCQPFSAQIRIALAVNFSTEQYSGCTLTQVNKNISDFGNTFDAWNQWLQVTTQPADNQYGAYIQESGLLSDKINSVLANVNSEINRNGGFLDFKVCDQYEDQAAVDSRLSDDGYTSKTGDGSADFQTESQPQCLHYTTETPGTAISGALTGSYSAEFNKIGLATDIDQVIGALVDELVSSTLTGAGGLLGSKSSSAPISGNVNISALAAQQSASNAQTIAELNGQAAQAQTDAASTTQAILSTSQSTASAATTTPSSPSVLFSNPSPVTNPILISSTSKLPTYSINFALPSSGLQAVVNLGVEPGQSYTPTKSLSQVFDQSVYALNVGNQNGTVNADLYGSLLQNGTITIQNIPNTDNLFNFSLRELPGISAGRYGGHNNIIYDLTITIEDSSGNVLGTQITQLQLPLAN